MLDDFVNIITVIIISIIAIPVFYFSWYWWWNKQPCRQTKEKKHVRFSDDTVNSGDNIMNGRWLENWKNYIIQHIKKMFFHSHIENGILKTTRYTSDSPYAEIFG
jgi:hypothetical protein